MRWLYIMVARLVKPVRPWLLKAHLSLRRVKPERLWKITKRKHIDSAGIHAKAWVPSFSSIIAALFAGIALHIKRN